jgi:hypothetical protein
VLSFKVPSMCTFPRMPAAKLDEYPLGGWHHTNDHGWLFKRSPRFTDGIYQEAGSFLTTPTEGCGGVNYGTCCTVTLFLGDISCDTRAWDMNGAGDAVHRACDGSTPQLQRDCGAEYDASTPCIVPSRPLLPNGANNRNWSCVFVLTPIYFMV